jgi:transcriptional regulator with XRE-family HTH domain
MEKTISSNEYALFIEHLKEVRMKAGLTQAQLAERLGETQSFVSKCERGERRLDVVEVRAFCLALGVPFPAFVAQLDKLFSHSNGKK